MRECRKLDTCAAPLGQLAATRGTAAAICPRFEKLARNAWFTRKISVLMSASCPPADSPAELARFTERLQLQRASYELTDVPLAALGDQAFADAVRSRGIVCLSLGRGLDNDNVVAVMPPGELVASVDGPTFEQLGLEEPAQGANRLLKKLLPAGRRHVRVDLGISKTRMRRAPSPKEAISRWRSLAPPHELCTMAAYCEHDGEDSYDFEPLRACGATARRIEVPFVRKRIRLEPNRDAWSGVVPSAFGVAHTTTTARPPFEELICQPDLWEEASYGETCEELLDWLGALHLGIVVPFDGGGVPASKTSPEEAYLWTIGESLIGPAQVLRTLSACMETLSAPRSWVLLSVWGTEDAPVSHHGCAHGFDLSGAHHIHLLAVRGQQAESEPQCLLLEATNALSATPASAPPTACDVNAPVPRLSGLGVAREES